MVNLHMGITGPALFLVLRQTGIKFHPVSYTQLAGMAVAGLIGIVTKDRKKEQENHDNG